MRTMPEIESEVRFTGAVLLTDEERRHYTATPGWLAHAKDMEWTKVRVQTPDGDRPRILVKMLDYKVRRGRA